jgi:hypothetical protein
MIRFIRSCSALLLLALLGCGGGQFQKDVDLQGTWYFQTRDDRATLVGRHIITQRGDDVLITYCNRSTYALSFPNGVLIDPRGLPYYLQPVDSHHLVGMGDSGNRSQAVKVSNKVTFDSGSLSFLADGTDALTTSDDVCADDRAGRYVALDGTEISPRVVTMTAPYKDSFIRIQAALHSLQPGSYSVLDLDSFVHTPSSTYITIESPVFGDTLGNDGSVWIASGTVLITSSSAEDFQIHGFVMTHTGSSVSFSAKVVLGK